MSKTLDRFRYFQIKGAKPLPWSGQVVAAATKGTAIASVGVQAVLATQEIYVKNVW